MPRRIRRLPALQATEESLFRQRLPAEERLGAAAAALSDLGALLGAELLTERQRQRLRTRWTRCVPQVARRLADLLEQEGPALASLPVRADELRGGEGRIAQLAGLRAGLEALLERVCDLQLVEKAALRDRAERGLRALELAGESPLTEPELAARLRVAAGAVRAPIEGRRAAMLQRRRARAALGREREAALGALDGRGDRPP